ncbi:MAG TPA: hypothetical protein VNH11_02130 [Pirellulales bacterium]|nr:hypothetical protein [Pirellulales bacterium]
MEQATEIAAPSKQNTMPFGVIAALVIVLLLATLPFVIIGIGLFVPGVDTIKMMGAGTLLFAFLLVLVGLYCVVIGFMALHVKATGRTTVSLWTIFGPASVITSQMATMFVLAGVSALGIAGYVMTHSHVKEVAPVEKQPPHGLQGPPPIPPWPKDSEQSPLK